mmetsp:Transcript_12415/g.24633  ORF Transcript_12415/g.24633 Transcript_12415/m.24633 type:complete len:203 (-) Transcript_12415:238-846(-)
MEAMRRGLNFGPDADDFARVLAELKRARSAGVDAEVLCRGDAIIEALRMLALRSAAACALVDIFLFVMGVVAEGVLGVAGVEIVTVGLRDEVFGVRDEAFLIEEEAELDCMAALLSIEASSFSWSLGSDSLRTGADEPRSDVSLAKSWRLKAGERVGPPYPPASMEGSILSGLPLIITTGLGAIDLLGVPAPLGAGAEIFFT